MTVSALAPERCKAMPLATSPSPLSSAMPRRSSPANSTRAMSLSSTGVPPSDLDDDVFEIADASEIAAAAHHELVLG